MEDVMMAVRMGRMMTAVRKKGMVRRKVDWRMVEVRTVEMKVEMKALRKKVMMAKMMVKMLTTRMWKMSMKMMNYPQTHWN